MGRGEIADLVRRRFGIFKAQRKSAILPRVLEHVAAVRSEGDGQPQLLCGLDKGARLVSRGRAQHEKSSRLGGTDHGWPNRCNHFSSRGGYDYGLPRLPLTAKSACDAILPQFPHSQIASAPCCERIQEMERLKRSGGRQYHERSQETTAQFPVIGLWRRVHVAENKIDRVVVFWSTSKAGRGKRLCSFPSLGGNGSRRQGKARVSVSAQGVCHGQEAENSALCRR